MGWLTSNSAANEWCAFSGCAASRTAPMRRPQEFAFMTHYSSQPRTQRHLCVSVTLWLVVSVAQASAQTYTPPKTADGHPDLQGIWQVLNTAAWDIQDHGASLGVPAGRGVVEGNDIPYTLAALAKKQENFKNRDALDPINKCFLPGVPRLTYQPHPFQIVQLADRVTILHEYSRVIRFIYMNGNPHPAGKIDWYMGDSRGRWDGNTLVV